MEVLHHKTEPQQLPAIRAVLLFTEYPLPKEKICLCCSGGGGLSPSLLHYITLHYHIPFEVIMKKKCTHVSIGAITLRLF